MPELNHLRKLLENIETVKFSSHFFKKTKERPISEGLIKEKIKQTKTLLKAEEQHNQTKTERKYKLWFKLSNKYDLVLICAFNKKTLYIITGWNTDRKWKK